MNADVMVETLRKRVEQTVLQSETIKVDRMGKSNVSWGGVAEREWNRPCSSQKPSKWTECSVKSKGKIAWRGAMPFFLGAMPFLTAPCPFV